MLIVLFNVVCDIVFLMSCLSALELIATNLYIIILTVGAVVTTYICSMHYLGEGINSITYAINITAYNEVMNYIILCT